MFKMFTIVQFPSTAIDASDLILVLSMNQFGLIIYICIKLLTCPCRSFIVLSYGLFSQFYCQVVLAEEELVVIDLSDLRWRPLRLPYLVSVHASAITTTQLVDNVAANVYDNIVAAGQFNLAILTNQL